MEPTTQLWIPFNQFYFFVNNNVSEALLNELKQHSQKKIDNGHCVHRRFVPPTNRCSAFPRPNRQHNKFTCEYDTVGSVMATSSIFSHGKQQQQQQEQHIRTKLSFPNRLTARKQLLSIVPPLSFFTHSFKKYFFFPPIKQNKKQSNPLSVTVV